MNPLASTKCAARLLMALAAISGLFLTAGCGSSSVKTNSEGFTNASLTGTYVFSSTGVDATNGEFLAVAGSFPADGNGNVTAGGTIDINSLSFGHSSTAISPATAAYRVGTDGRGQITLTTSSDVLPGIVLDFVLTSSSHGLVTEFDGDGTGSGTIDLQTTGALTGSYSFGLSGAAAAGTPLAMVGTFSTSVDRPQGISFNGLADINSNGTAPGGLLGLNLAATVTAGSPGTATLSAYNSSNTLVATYNFDVYMVDVTHLKFIETDSDTAQVLAGDAFTQQPSIPDGVYAFSMGGLDSTTSVGPLAMAGFFTSTSGALSAVLQDYNDIGNVNEVAGTGGAFTTITGGRTELTLTGIYNGVPGLLASPTFAAYPSSGGIEMLEIDNPTDGEFGITGGIALPQGSTTTISTTPGYGLNLSAANGGGFEEDDIAEFTLDSGGNYKGAEDANDEGSTTPNISFTGALTPDTAVAGHGFVTNSSTFNFNYFVANNGATILILETDSNQLGLGSFEPQSSSGSDVRMAAAHAQFSPVRVMLKGKAAWKKHSK